VPLLTLDFTEASRHRLQASLRFRPRGPRLSFHLPRWTPGSYLLREYARHLESLEVSQGGRSLSPRRLAPNRWQIEDLAPDEEVEIRSWHQATELSVRTCHLNADHGFVTLAAVLLLVDGERWEPHRLALELPPGWEPFVPLPRSEDGHWLAADADQLIDTPVEVGPHPSHAFTVAGIPHRWVGWGGDLPAVDPDWLADVERVCGACCRLIGEEAPAAPDYLFVLHLLENGYGGLEHDRSTVLQYGRRTLGRPEGRRRLLQLVAHEYLHQWNVRRLRPAELCPINYDREVIVPTLWFAEGVTSYYDQLLPLLAGCSSEDDLLEDLGADLSRYRLNRGRRIQSLRQSSEEAWVKLYRADATSPENQVSYYLKGAVVALALDLHLRAVGSCLAVVLRHLWQHWGRHGRGYGPDDLLALFRREDAALAELLPRWLEGTSEADEPDLDTYLASVGLELLPERAAGPDLGLSATVQASALVVQGVERGGPACRAGVDVGDELLALAGRRQRTPEDLEALGRDPFLELPLPQGEEDGPPALPLELWIGREGLVRRLKLVPRPPRVERWKLSWQSDPAAEVLERRRAWLSLVP
jgi:predicted metalloprotease with PDZ domain